MTQHVDAGLVPTWTVGDRLRKAREMAGLQAQELASDIDVDRNTVGNYERGRVKPRTIVLKAWALRTGVSLQWLQTGETPAGPGGPDGGQEVRHQGLEPRTRCVTAIRPAVTVRRRVAA